MKQKLVLWMGLLLFFTNNLLLFYLAKFGLKSTHSNSVELTSKTSHSPHPFLVYSFGKCMEHKKKEWIKYCTFPVYKVANVALQYIWIKFVQNCEFMPVPEEQFNAKQTCIPSFYIIYDGWDKINMDNKRMFSLTN